MTLDVTDSTFSTYRVVYGESMHFDRLKNLNRYRREPLAFVRSRNTAVVHVNIVAWAREVIGKKNE